MSVVATTPVIETALWPQGDARDPLGVWAARSGSVGDGTGGNHRTTIIVPAEKRRSRLYTCYFLSSVRTGGASSTSTRIKAQLLTNWPDASLDAGVTGFATFMEGIVSSNVGNFPVQGSETLLVQGIQRFILLFDPASVSPTTDMAIAAIERDANTDLEEIAWEAYGYWWDRAVVDAPGGPRHPGSN